MLLGAQTLKDRAEPCLFIGSHFPGRPDQTREQPWVSGLAFQPDYNYGQALGKGPKARLCCDMMLSQANVNCPIISSSLIIYLIYCLQRSTV